MGVLKVWDGTDWRKVGCGGATAGTFTDDFNRVDSTTTLGSPWFTLAREVIATWGISSNKAYVVSTPLAPSFTWWESLALIDIGTADFDMSVTVTWTGSRRPLMAWRVSQDRDGTANKPSFFAVSADASYGAGKYATGSGLSTLAFGTNFNSGDVCRVTCVGNVHTVYKNGVSIYSFSDSMNNTETWHGLAGIDPALGDNRYDDFSITTLVESGRLRLWTGAEWVQERCADSLAVGHPLKIEDPDNPGTWITVACMTAIGTTALYDTAVYDTDLYG